MVFGKSYTINLKEEFTKERLGNSMSTKHEFLKGTYRVLWKRGNPVEFKAVEGDRFLVTTGNGFPEVVKMQSPNDPLRAMLWKYNFFRNDQKHFGTKDEFNRYVRDNFRRYSRSHGMDIRDYILLETDNIAVAYRGGMEGWTYSPQAWWTDRKKVTQSEIKEMENKIKKLHE